MSRVTNGIDEQSRLVASSAVDARDDGADERDARDVRLELNIGETSERGRRAWFNRWTVGMTCAIIGGASALAVLTTNNVEGVSGSERSRASASAPLELAGTPSAASNDDDGSGGGNTSWGVGPKVTRGRVDGVWIDSVERVAAAARDADTGKGVVGTPGRGQWIQSRSSASAIASGDDTDDDSNVNTTWSNVSEATVAEAFREYARDAWIENYAEAKRRERREEYLMKRGIDPKEKAVHALPKLGATRDDCPSAYTAPPERSLGKEGGGRTESELGKTPAGFTKFSAHSTKLADLADHIYILCMKCSLNIPREWKGKSSFVHGLKIDKCLQTEGVNHWLKASFSHAHAMMDAIKQGYQTIAIVEEDVITRDLADRNEGLRVLYENMAHMRDAMKRTPDWKTIRLGYRTMFIDRPWESTSKIVGDEKCPSVCRCNRLNAFTCVMRDKGCDMRSSDFYLVRKEAFEPIIESVYRGRTIDCEALSQVSNQIFVTPQLSFQSNLDLSLEKQLSLSSAFVQACAAS